MKQEKSSQTKPTLRDFRDLVDTAKDRFGDRVAYVVKQKKETKETPAEYRKISYREFWEEIRAFSTALSELCPAGSHIAVIGENRYEWCLSYLSITCGGNVVVPVDRDLKPEELHMVLERSGACAVIYSGKVYEKSLREVLETLPAVTAAICMDTLPAEAPAGTYTVAGLLARGRELLANGDTCFDTVELDPEKLSVLIFTSGTTGIAKGVMLSQRNICCDILSVMQCLDHSEEDSMLSILPLHHTYECTCTFLVSIRMGGCVSFCEGTRYIAKNIQEYKPSIVMMVPLILENVHAKIVKQAKTSKLRYAAFRFLLGFSGFLRLFGIDAGRKFFPQVHETMGGRLRLVIAGAAAMSPRVAKDMTRMGFKIRQGYGLTECAPILCVNRESRNDFNSVGPAMPDVQIRIDRPDEEGRGEILAKGGNIMMGYYENEEATRAAFDDEGWFRTGDQGKIDAHGRLYVTGRIKNMIVNKTGKNIYPEELEALIGKIPYVQECVVWGDNSSSDEDTVICVTVVPNAEAIRESGADPNDRAAAEALIWPEIKKINKGLATWKRVQRLELRTEEFEKTTTRKIKRYILNLGKK